MAMELDTNGILKVSACDKVRRQRHPTPPSTTRPNHKRTLPSSPQVNVVQRHVLTIHVSVDHGRREFSGDHRKLQKGRLSTAEVDKMVAEAEKYAAEDTAFTELVIVFYWLEAKNAVEMLAYQTWWS